MTSCLKHILLSRLNTEPKLVSFVQRNYQYYSTKQGKDREVWTQKIANNLELKGIKQDGVVQHARPLLLLFGWMWAKQKHIQKYEELYLKRGYNILTVSCNPLYGLIKASHAPEITRKVLDHIEDRSHDFGKQPIVIHGFSVGACLIGEFHVQLNTEETIARDLLVAQVLDSPFDFEGIPGALAKVLTDHKVLRFLIRNAIKLYMSVFKGNVAKLQMASAALKENKCKVPSLFLMSKADLVGDVERFEGVIKDFHKRRIPIRHKTWHDSPHVGHYQYHPDEYAAILTSFLDTYEPNHVAGQWSQGSGVKSERG